ncbi:MAG: aminotransferase class III-fold pyridoxal phosphate-dependent enzyme, partial [Gammaproteobacteria bacterium]|nr:aminotransferase class III-fold pyridoxal phosphate-dependent enzyme [Gammaproteobacteria bacterium]
MSTSPIPGDVLEAPAPQFSVEHAERIAKQIFGMSACAYPLPSERDQNFQLQCEDERVYVLKIANPAEDPAVLDFQIKALQHIATHDPELPVPRVCPTLSANPSHILDSEGQRFILRLVTHLEGVPLSHKSSSLALRHNIGHLLARLGRALRGFFHPAAGHELLWDLKTAGRLRQHLMEIADSKRRELAERTLDRFEDCVLPILTGLRAQVIHNDANPDNLLVDPNDPTRITGIIDFGDMVHTALINDVAIAVAYQLSDEADPIVAACDLIAGYHAVTALSDEELDVLFQLICARLATSGIISAWRVKSHPENRDYILSHDQMSWGMLERLAKLNPDEVAGNFRDACGLPGRFMAQVGRYQRDNGMLQQLIERRHRTLGRAFSLTYEEPLHIVRGDGVWLYDASGRVYLDAYNNVPHVGHCHPDVVAALSRQAYTLNTNTRYLHEYIVEYGERLAATLPGDLGVCMFVCSGSEANDLAVRIARACTGADGAVVTQYSYHGNTNVLRQMSLEDLPTADAERWVATVPAPDVYAGTHRANEENVGGRYATYIDTAIDALSNHGHNLGVCMFDSMFASDGIFVPPDGYLSSVYERVHAVGGLCVADEVQSGFGRSGTHMWGFELQGVVPDIVTLGKPMGNGHPLAAVITTPAIAESFSRSQDYFNTFGGNPVSCAVGLAVLDVIEREALQQNSLVVGGYLKGRIEALMEKHDLIGDVRGAGLFLGVEIARD